VSVYLWLNEDNVDEQHDKVMFNILVCKLFAFILCQSRPLTGVHTESDGHCLWSRSYTATIQGESIPHSDNEEKMKEREGEDDWGEASRDWNRMGTFDRHLSDRHLCNFIGLEIAGFFLLKKLIFRRIPRGRHITIYCLSEKSQVALVFFDLTSNVFAGFHR
jgi:hypothetical protein